jgi:hypothetical protein
MTHFLFQNLLRLQFPIRKTPRSRFRQSSNSNEEKQSHQYLARQKLHYLSQSNGTFTHNYAIRSSSLPSSSNRFRLSPFSIHTPFPTTSSLHPPPHHHHPQPPYRHPRYPNPPHPHISLLPFPLLLLQILRRFRHSMLRHSLLPPCRCRQTNPRHRLEFHPVQKSWNQNRLIGDY